MLFILTCRRKVISVCESVMMQKSCNDFHVSSLVLKKENNNKLDCLSIMIVSVIWDIVSRV